ncbi:uncharacterized protein LOC133912860 [Phragmites australis]|uniref:uncharacterized protein LOC133912860 n=1 Tax=Phragmites australis TaxID=29695 RepID=UPI002D79FC20|nr:uncharacterized protein LOC133912860 [Phragmites australis]
MSAQKPPPSHEACGAYASPGSTPPEPQREQEEVAAQGRTPLERAADATEELYHLRDTFFPGDPAEKAAALRARADAALVLLDALPPEQRKSPQQRGVYEFFRGKILDVFPKYNKEAEDHLSKAVKLNPSLVDAWLCLGNCIWKKGDLAAAKNCFSLALSKGSDKKILCQLSMLERSMAQGSEDQALLVEGSIKHAKEAVMLDIKDGNSWYNLGNAYLTSFFVGGAWDHTKLHHSVKAYQNAEKDQTMNLNPDLYYNCATADRYLENYERALHGFEAAAIKDPGLGANTEVQKIISLLDKLENAMKGQLRSKRLASLVSSLSDVNLKSLHKKATVSILSEGLNKAVVVLGKVVLLIRYDNVAPLYYLTCDLDQCYFILSVYGLRNDAIKEGDRVALFEPYYRILDTSWKEKHYQFKSIRVDFPEQILINEKAPAPHHVVRASIHAHNKP